MQAWQALTDALRARASVGECVAALEGRLPSSTFLRLLQPSTTFLGRCVAALEAAFVPPQPPPAAEAHAA